jgi:L-fuculose-phosphate aldolase
MDSSLLTQFQQVGRDLFVSRLITSHGGNLSICRDDSIIITRSGSQLAHLDESDLVEVSLSCADERDALASCELVVHRAIYLARREQWGECEGAIAHAHALATTVRSFLDEVITPIDSEARLLIPRVPVVSATQTIGSAEAAQVLAQTLSVSQDPNQIAVLKEHGPFAHGSTLEDAFRLISVLEHSCEIINVLQSL